MEFLKPVTILLCCMSVVSNGNKTLYIGVLLELSEHWYAPYTGFFPSMFKHAFEGIYNQSDLLKDFKFELVIRDTKGKPGLAAKHLVELVNEAPPKVAIIGPTLSASLTVTGQMVPYYKLLELSYIATTASTADSDLFPTLFKVNQVTNALNPLRIKMMQHFGWTRVGTLAYQEEFSVSQLEAFHGLLRDNNMTLITSAVISDINSIKDILKRFKQFGVRIIMAAFRGTIAPYVFCQAYYQEMFGDDYIWILSGPSLFAGWIDQVVDRTFGCSKEELIIATNGHFTLDHLKESNSTEKSISGKTPGEVMHDLQTLINQTHYKMSSFAGWIYDTPWALALGLNNSIKYLNQHNLSLENYNYSSKYLDAAVKGMREVSFDGVSGPVAFDAAGSRIGINFIQQNFHNDVTNVAIFDEKSRRLDWLVESSTLWEGKTVPLDRFIYQDVLEPPNHTAFSLVVALDSGGCVLSVVFLFFNVFFRNKRLIKMSSPMINNVIIAGCLLMYMEVLLNAVNYRMNSEDEVGNRLCMARTWLLSVGFTCLFGALFSKTYRVYVVFRDYKLKRKPIKDYHLFGIIGTMLVIDCAILIPWTIVFPFQKVQLKRTTMDAVDNNMIFSKIYLYCGNQFSNYWIAAMYVYKGLLLAFGTFLAWETRQVNVPALNDSKYIGACIYNVVIVCIFGVPLTHVLSREQMTLTFVLESCLIFFCTTICACIIFIPKIKGRNQVQGRFVTATQPSDSNMAQLQGKLTISGNSEGRPVSVVDDITTSKELKTENEKLRMEIAKESIAIAKLRKSLLQISGNIHFYKSGQEYIVFRSKCPQSNSSVCLTTEEKLEEEDF